VKEMTDQKPTYEEFKVNGEAVVGKVKELIHEGNIRRIIIKNDKGDTLIEIPLTFGVVGVILLPVWAALGALAALAANLTIVVEKDPTPSAPAAGEDKEVKIDVKPE
jgi:hypothetical protein